MHRAHSIPNDDLRYVLCTFVVVPVQWVDQYGKRPLDDGELVATVRYYQELGRRMAIRDIPADYAGVVDTMDRYEVEHFDFRPGSRVSDRVFTVELSSGGGRATRDRPREIRTDTHGQRRQWCAGKGRDRH